MDNANPRGKEFLALACLICFISIILGYGLSHAAVSGPCANCHTMHNSQDGSPLARIGNNVGWSGSALTGDTSAEPLGHLLVTDCVGCHTSTTTDTIIDLGITRIPIVYNTVTPTDPLAGGNFHWVAGGAAYDGYGHNVYGISAQDSNLDVAPGQTRSTCGGNSGSCHVTLADPPSNNNSGRGGCRGCHYYTFHHTDNEVYRFLMGHQGANNYASGIEDPDWEQDPSAGHNMYRGVNGPVDEGDMLDDTHSISSYCGGCHGVFHRMTETSGSGSTRLNIGTSSPWLRHPTDILLPNDREYAGYDPSAPGVYNPATGAGYSAEAPVAWINPAAPTRASAVVMCLSCHRPHGSDQPDMLRWDYSTMDVGSGNTGGCFTCHTAKN